MHTSAAPSCVSVSTLVENAIDVVRIAVGRVNALASLAEESFDNTVWRDADALQLDRMAHLLGSVAAAASTALAAATKLHGVVVAAGSVSNVDAAMGAEQP